MKKRTIKLNESDLERLVERIMTEETDSNTEDEFLNMLVENVIREEEGEEKNDDPQDVQRFLDLADKYLFNRYGKYAEKINTPQEKATLIAALAQKWGVDVNDLSRVKRYLTKEQREQLDEIGYDSPEVFAQHAGSLMGQVRSMFNNLTQMVKEMEQNLDKPKSVNLQTLNKLTGGINMLSMLLERMIPEMPEDDLGSASEEFVGVLKSFERRIRTLVTAATAYSDKDFSEQLEKFLVKFTTSMMKYGKVILDVDKRLYQRAQGRGRGDYGSGYDLN